MAQWAIAFDTADSATRAAIQAILYDNGFTDGHIRNVYVTSDEQSVLTQDPLCRIGFVAQQIKLLGVPQNILFLHLFRMTDYNDLKPLIK